MNLVISVILLLAVMTILLFAFRNGMLAGNKNFHTNIESLNEDYDNDGEVNFYDKCDCVGGQDVILSDKTDGKEYCFFADLPSTGGCGSITVGAGLKLLEKTASTGNKVCVVEPTSCKKAMSDYYECLDLSKESEEALSTECENILYS